jgi:hypothetical protein
MKRAAYLVAAYVRLSDEASKYILCFVSDLRLACISPFRLKTLDLKKEKYLRLSNIIALSYMQVLMGSHSFWSLGYEFYTARAREKHDISEFQISS